MKKVILLVAALISGSSLFPSCIKRKEIKANNSLLLYDSIPTNRNSHASHASHVSHYSCLRDSTISDIPDSLEQTIIQTLLENEKIDVKKDVGMDKYVSVANLYMFNNINFSKPKRCICIKLYYYGNRSGTENWDYLFNYYRAYFIPIESKERYFFLHEMDGKIYSKYQKIKKTKWMEQIIREMGK